MADAKQHRPVPESVRTILAQHNAAAPVQALVIGNLQADGRFGQTWVCICSSYLWVVSVSDGGRSNGRQPTAEQETSGQRTAKAKHVRHTEDGDERNQFGQPQLLARYDLSQVETVSSEAHVGSLRLKATISGSEVVLCRALQGKAKEFNAFAKAAAAILEGREPSPDDLDYEEQKHCPKCGRLFPDPDRPICPHCMNKRALFMRVIAMAPHCRWKLVLITMLMLLQALLGLASPYLGGRVFFDEVIRPDGRLAGQILLVVSGMFLFRLAEVSTAVTQGRINAVVAAQIVYDIKARVFAAMQQLSLAFFNRRLTGSLMHRVNNDANNLRFFFHDGVPMLVVNTLSLTGIVAVLFFMDWRLTLLVLVPTPLILVLIRKLYPLLWKLHAKRFRFGALLNALVNDSLSGIRVVKAFGREQREVERFAFRNQNVFDISVQSGRLSASIFPLVSFFMGTGALLIWGVGGWMVIHGELTFGTLVSFTAYLGMFYGPLQFMTHLVDWWTHSMNAAQRMFEIIDSDVMLPTASDPIRLAQIEGHIAVEQVDFAYEEGKPVLHEVSFEVKPGEMIGLVGHSGAGKSTMINLIARLYDPDRGVIRIDGTDIRTAAPEDLRRQIGLVLQDTFLFSGTILENIAYARPEAPKEDIIRAAAIANAHTFITKLADGYETVIGHKGIDLSGGERQRIAIARAILHDPRILILDEATASIDTETEQLIQEALEELIRGRTTLAIAHRLSTLRKADRLLVFDKGRLVETGSHAELLAKKGIYHKQFITQREALRHTGVGGSAT